jgi:MFS family permease
MPTTRSRLVFTLCVLAGINMLNFFDRQVPGAVAEPIRETLNLNDQQLGWIITAFVLLYAAVGLPLGRWADIGRRKLILAAGVTVWSLFTVLSGLAGGFWSLFALRMGVGVGEASCAPAASSLLGDLFPREQRGRAIAVFMLGLPVGLGLSSIVSGNIAGYVARHWGPDWGWRAAFFVAGVPGLVLGLLCLGIPEPARGAAEGPEAGAPLPRGAGLTDLLRIPTFWWIILSGVLHNFNMYALGAFLSPLLQRYHGQSIGQAGWVSGVVYCCGGMGILLGGWACDRMVRRRISGRLEVSALSLAVGVPCVFMAVQQPAGAVWAFTAWLLPGCLLFYVYYSAVYATIQDIVEPARRGTAMALYFLAMYFLGAAWGSVVTGGISDYFARRPDAPYNARLVAGLVGSVSTPASFPANLPWPTLYLMKDEAKASGLHNAFYVIPVLGIALVLVLSAASRTVTGDYRKLQHRLAQNHPVKAKVE